MPLEQQRWDPTRLEFIYATLRIMAGLAVGVTLGGGWIYRPALSGLLSGTGIAVLLFLIVMLAGRVLERSQSFARTMLCYLSLQFVLWVGVALLLIVINVHPVGFVVGVSILPVAVLLAMGWSVVRGGSSSS